PAALNGADEVLVQAFLDERIAFLQIPRLLEQVLARFPDGEADTVDRILEADRWARATTESLISSAS
ncbi:MAG: 1-deoxy-D-xylulose-5-phosphate reductoisomerase, partial [Candidatus Eisenbacteria bacterium]|nr:1-deoxy-D-xylulose-5-phosphate reductoisomerase [Candidatus Eisenbacteria bacterium]